MAENPPMLKFGLRRGSPYPCEIAVTKNKVASSYPEHSHECSELVVALEGTAIHRVCGRETLIGPGDVFAVNPDVSHSFARADGFVHYNITYMKGNLESLCRELRQMPGYQELFILGASNPDFRCLRLSEASLRRISDLIERIKSEQGRAKPGCEPLVRACFIELVVELSRLMEQRSERASSDDGFLARFAALASHLERSFVEPVSSGEMARMAGVSERQLRRLFAKHYGSSPLDYVLKLRLRRAAELLVSTEKTVSEAAFASGFNDSNYFCRQFRKSSGFSPLEYRRLRRAGLL